MLRSDKLGDFLLLSSKKVGLGKLFSRNQGFNLNSKDKEDLASDK